MDYENFIAKKIRRMGESSTIAISQKANLLRQQGVNVISLAVGEPDFDTPANIKNKAIASIKDGFTKYTAVDGVDDLKKAICHKFKQENDLDYSPSEVIVSCGAKHSLYNLAQVLFEQDDEVVILAPYWVTYPAQVELTGAKAVIIDTSTSENLMVTREELEACLTSKTKAIMLNNPCNPSGKVYSKAELGVIADAAVRNNIFIISDDIYEKFVYGEAKHVSVATFIPKPHTPFQWAPQVPLAESKERINWLKDRLSVPGIRFKWQNPEVSFLEGVWSRGDRRLSRLLLAAYQAGCRFDGWSDSFQPDKWRRALKETGIDADFFTTRSRRLEEPLPWDHIDTRVDKSFLAGELEKALAGEHLPDCRSGACHSCGVCDFEKIAPIIADSCPPPPAADKISAKSSFVTYAVSYYKKEQARFFGHLELVNIFLRALKRAEIPLKYSEGFHPLPKVSFADPLPVGIESENETLYLTVAGSLKPHLFIRKLNRHLTAGLRVLACEPVSPAFKGRRAAGTHYRVTLKYGNFDQKAITYFQNCSQMVISRRGKKGKVKQIDLKKAVSALVLQPPNQLRMTLEAQAGNTPRPHEVLRKIFSLPETAIKLARIVKTAEVFLQADIAGIHRARANSGGSTSV